MATIGIRGIELGDLAIDADKADEARLTGSYNLMSTADKVLAKQAFNGYGGLKVAWSRETLAKLEDLRASVKADVESMLGLGLGGEA